MHGHDLSPPAGTAQWLQKAWNTIRDSVAAERLLESASDTRSRASLLMASSKESGAWLQVLPISSLGLCMDDNTIRVLVGLWLGSSLFRPHTCHHCGAKMDGLATHDRSCCWSEGWHYRHASLSDILQCALFSAKVHSRLEPAGIGWQEIRW